MKTGELEKKDTSLLSITSSSTAMHERVTPQWCNLIKPAFILLADTKQQVLEASRLAAVNYCWFYTTNRVTASRAGRAKLLRPVSVSCRSLCLHEHLTNWEGGRHKGNPGFPSDTDCCTLCQYVCTMYNFGCKEAERKLQRNLSCGLWHGKCQ